MLFKFTSLATATSVALQSTTFTSLFSLTAMEGDADYFTFLGLVYLADQYGARALHTSIGTILCAER